MQSSCDTCFYYDEEIFVVVYVDDILIASKNEKAIHKFIVYLSSKLIVKNLGKIKRFLNINVEKIDDYYEINQADYIMELAKSYNLENIKKSKIPLPSCVQTLKEAKIDNAYDTKCRELLGSLLYLSEISRPDLSASVNILATYSTLPSKELFECLKRILRYTISTIDHVLSFKPRSENIIEGFADSDYANDILSRKSRTGYMIKFYGMPISWKSKKQETVALSTAEAEYVSLSCCVSELIGFRNFLNEFKIMVNEVTVYCDNRSAIFMAENFYSKVKHIDIRYHFVRELLKSKSLKIVYIPSDENPADMFTKCSSRLFNRKSLIGLEVKGGV